MIKTDSRINFLKEVAKHLGPKNPVCVELGVYRGEFSSGILSVLEPDVLHLVDPWAVGDDKNAGSYGFIPRTAYATSEDCSYVAGRFSNEIKSGQVVIHKKYSYDAVKSFPDKYFDFIYIDACHLYDAVKSDLRDYLPKLKETGLMCGHDYFDSDIFGVVPAVNEFIKENGFEFLILNVDGPDCWDWALKRKT